MAADMTWKELHLRHMEFKYGAKYKKWMAEPPTADDRLVFVNMYHKIIEAINSLPDEPNNYICVAMNRKMEQDRQILDEIMKVFADR